MIVQLSTDTTMSVLLLGSSHMNRLKHYVNKLQQQEFNLDGNIINLFGINGVRIGNNDHCRRWETYIEQVKPMHIIVHIGGNDLDCPNCNNETAEEIILKIIALFDIFRVRFHINNITFVQPLERQHTRHVPVQIYNNLVKYANNFLKINVYIIGNQLESKTARLVYLKMVFISMMWVTTDTIRTCEVQLFSLYIHSRDKKRENSNVVLACSIFSFSVNC